MRAFARLLTYLFILLFIYSCSTDSTPVYQLSTSAEPAEAGSVTQSAAEAEQGETITITANANEHWVLIGGVEIILELIIQQILLWIRIKV
jgi:hypothetical protein